MAQVNIGIFLGLVFLLVSRIYALPFALLCGSVLLALGLCRLRKKNKGYSEFFGLLGVFSLFGLLILVLMPSNER